MKIQKFIIINVIVLVACMISSANLNAASLAFEKVSSIESSNLSYGVNYERLDALTTNDSGTVKSQKISWVSIEKGSAEIVTWSKYNSSGIVGSTVTNIAKDYEAKNPGYKVVAATNADYFNMSNYDPTNSIVQNGDVVKYSNHSKYPSIAFNSDGSGLIKVKDNTVSSKYYLTIYSSGNLTPIKEVILNGYNQKPGTNQTTFFYKYDSALNMSGTTCFEIANPDAYFNLASIFIKGQVTGKVTSLEGQPIISTTNEELVKLLEQNPYIRIQKMMTGENEGYQNVIGVGSQPLVNGVILQNSEIGDQNVDFCATRAPRTSIGWTEEGNIVIAAIDGRQSSNGMNGVSLREEAVIMKSLGCNNAFNFDGGGSTELIIRNGNTFKTTNSPSDGSSRKVSTALLVVVPDVVTTLNISEITKTAAKVEFNAISNGNGGVSDIKTKVIVNGDYQQGTESSFYITGLKEGEANFVSLEVSYKLEGVSKTSIYKTTKIYTTEISDPTDVVKVKPSNFDVKFERTENGFDVIVTCDDPSETLKKVYLVCNGESQIAIKDIRGYAVNYPITNSVDMEFEIKYEYNLGTVKNVNEVCEEKFIYKYIVEPKDFLVNFNPNTKKQGFDVSISYDPNGCEITKIVVKYDGEEVECVNGVATIANAEEKIYELSVDVYYKDSGLELMKAVDGVYSYNYVNRGGCALFGIIDVLNLLSVGIVIFLIRKSN